MLHKIRVDEKDERSSAQQVENHLIKSSGSNNLPPQLLAAALDWCASPEGIPSLALLPRFLSFFIVVEPHCYRFTY